MVGEGVVNLASKAEAVTDKESYIDFRLRLLGEPGGSVHGEDGRREQPGLLRTLVFSVI